MATATKDTAAKTNVEKPDKPQYSYVDSFKHWWKRSSLQEAETDVLSLLPFFPESDGVRVAEILNIPIDDVNKIHEFNVKNITPAKEDHVVLVHGYGAALGFFYKNFESLTEKAGVNLHALDLLGYGLSSRPKLPKPLNREKNTIEDVTRVEGFFIDSLERWRQYKKIDKFLLIGHSLGGYLCSLYTLKYPQHVSKLVLISPVGVEKSIFDLSMGPDEHPTAQVLEGPDIEQEVGAHNEDTDKPAPLQSKPLNDPKTWEKPTSSLHTPDGNGYVTRIPNLPKYLVYLWDKNFSPFGILRSSGPLGPRITSNWSFRRFGNIDDTTEMMKLHTYSYRTFVAKASGEYALTRLLAPGVLARYPLLSRVPQQIKVDSLWLYGENDWMSKEAGKTIVSEINNRGIVKADYAIISNAGHHIYLDNPMDFKASIYKFFNW